MKKYGIRLKELREKAKYTQEELAKKLHISRSRLAMYEQGKRQPDFEMQEAIADFFNVSIDYLFGRNDVDLLVLDDRTKHFIEGYLQLPPELQQSLCDRVEAYKEALHNKP